MRQRRAFANDAPPFSAVLAAAASARAPASNPAASERVLPRRAMRDARASSGARVWLTLGSLAAAALLWLVVPALPQLGQPSASSEHGRAGETRTKGPPLHLDWVVRRGSRVFVPRADEPVHPGDALRFGVRVAKAGQVTILSLDAAGQLSVYQDWVRVDAGARQLLPGAVELDGVLGVERVYGVVCEQRWPLADLEGAIRHAPEQPALPTGCELERHSLQKVPP